jgi:gamma-glutamyltranspeptidase
VLRRPNPQGIAALQQLNILEHFDLPAMGFNSADYLHAHVEAKKLAFADRAKFYADPEFGGPSPELVRPTAQRAGRALDHATSDPGPAGGSLSCEPLSRHAACEPAPRVSQVASLISKEYAAQRVQLINMSRAARVVAPGTPPSKAAVHLGFPSTAAGQSLDHTSADTMYLTVADENGTMVSLIQRCVPHIGRPRSA